MQRWVDVEAQGGGLACISDVTYGYDLSDWTPPADRAPQPEVGRSWGPLAT